jgi:GxxExxY protein
LELRTTNRQGAKIANKVDLLPLTASDCRLHFEDNNGLGLDLGSREGGSMDPKNRFIGNPLAPKRQEPDAELDDFARSVIGAAIEVHRHLGPGLLEEVYEEALCMEFELRKIPFMRQERVGITYKGRPVGKGKLDLLVGGRLIVELKSVERLAPIHSAQIISYLRMTSRVLGLLINFNVPVLKEGIKRVVLS